jgi:PAS domain-containing protein
MRKKRIPISKHGIDRQIREKQELLDAVFQGIGDLVFITDTRRRITFANRAAIRISGYEKDEILGLAFSISAWSCLLMNQRTRPPHGASSRQLRVPRYPLN